MLFNLFKKDKESPRTANQYLTLRIRETVRETPDTISVYFDQPEPFLEYRPGQFLTLILEINGKEERRSYSLCTSPYLDPFPGITVKRLEGGLVSNYINDHFKPGMRVNIMRPLGNFISDYHSKNRRSYGMIAGGSGITPIMGILKSVLVNEPLSNINLLYCSRSEDMIIFNSSLEALKAKYPDRLKVVHNLTRPSDEWSGPSGRLDELNMLNFYKENFNLESRDELFFICGPEGLMTLAENTLSTLGIPKDKVVTELFYNEKEESVDEGTPALLTRPVTVILEGKEYTFDVSPEQSILEAGLEEQLDMPYSCQSGLCTACRGRLISGEVKMNEDAGLTEEEIAEGYILCCSSKATGPGIKIQIE